MTELLGRTLAGKYEVVSLLGEGGMGAVYEGKHIEIGKRVAIKVITNASSNQSSEIEGRFRREARAASAVESEHIVQVFDVGRDPDAGLYMVMEFLAGEDLASRLGREGRLDIGTSMVVAMQGLRGLAKAHAAGVVHRDLKPANVFLVPREDGTVLVKVLDFGISKLLREEAQDAPAHHGGKLTRVGSVMGTPQYMAPEQAQGLPVDHRADVWAFGAVLYECLAGRPAFEEGATYEQTIIRIVTTRPAPLAEVAPWVPATLAAAIHRALEVDPEQRFADCAAFLRTLQEALPQFGSNPTSFSSNPFHAGMSVSAESLSSLSVQSPRTLTGHGVMVRPARAAGELPDDAPVSIPGVALGRPRAMMVAAVGVFAMASLALLAGIVFRGRTPASSALGLVAAAPLPPRVDSPAPGAAPLPPMMETPSPTPSARAAPAASATQAVSPRTPKPAAAPVKVVVAPPASGAFGGVKVSDDY